jgi:hypothetical protein
MDIQQINRNDPESIKITVRNVDGGGSITLGLGACLVASAASFTINDAIPAVRSTAALQYGFLGVAAQTIPINGYGKVVSYGHAGTVQISHVGSSITVTAANILIPGAVAGTYFSTVTDAAMSTLLYRYVIATSTAVAISSQAQAVCTGFVRT